MRRKSSQHYSRVETLCDEEFQQSQANLSSHRSCADCLWLVAMVLDAVGETGCWQSEMGLPKTGESETR